MNHKTVSGPVSFKADDNSGEFEAVFSTLNVIDKDRDVTLPGAFTEGEEVRISYWAHRWEDLPVGKGVITANEREAVVKGKFFIDTEAGRETYQTVKNLGRLQEWSYGYDVLDESFGEFAGERVRFLRKLKVYEVSPVMLGAGINTRTTAIKEGRGDKAVDLKSIQAIHDAACQLGAKCAARGEGKTEGEAGDGKPSGTTSTLAARVALELLEAGID